MNVLRLVAIAVIVMACSRSAGAGEPDTQVETLKAEIAQLRATVNDMARAILDLRAQVKAQGSSSGGGRNTPRAPTDSEIKKAFRSYVAEWKKGELTIKADLKGVDVRDLSVEGTSALAKLRIEVKWKAGHNMEYTDGPLRNAPGVSGESYLYEEVFPLRFWTNRGWDFEGHLVPPEVRE